MKSYIILLAFIVLAGCASVDHETRSLVCLGFCTEQRIEHKAAQSLGDTNSCKATGTCLPKIEQE